MYSMFQSVSLMLKFSHLARRNLFKLAPESFRYNQPLQPVQFLILEVIYVPTPNEEPDMLPRFLNLCNI